MIGATAEIMCELALGFLRGNPVTNSREAFPSATLPNGTWPRLTPKQQKFPGRGIMTS
jgi:hypothetical protein